MTTKEREARENTRIVDHLRMLAQLWAKKDTALLKQYADTFPDPLPFYRHWKDCQYWDLCLN